jgi:hypothetical protein
MAKGLHTELNVITSDIRELYCQPSAENDDQSILITAEDGKLSMFFSNLVGTRYDTQELILANDYITVKKHSSEEEVEINSETHKFQLVNGNEICQYQSDVNKKKTVVKNIRKEKSVVTDFMIDGLGITSDIDQDKLKQFKFDAMTSDKRRVFSKAQSKFFQALFEKPHISISEILDLSQKHRPQELLKVIYPRAIRL